ncbi:hypothetical protein [Mesorhizobium sp. A623]
MLSRNGVFYFRWPLREAQAPNRHRSSIKVSLRTRDPRSALHLSRFLGYVAGIIEQYGARREMQFQDIRDLLHRHFTALLASRKLSLQQDGPLDALDLSILESSLGVAAEAVEGRNTLSIVTDDAALMSRFIDHYSLPLQTGDGEV